MASKERTLTVKILGDSASAEKSFDSTEGKAKSFGVSLDGVASLGVKALGALGLAAGALDIAMSQIGDGLERGALSDKLAAQFDLTAVSSKIAGEAAGNLYAGAYGGSLEEVNAAISSVGRNLLDLNTAGGSEIEGVTAKALDLAAAFDGDVNEVTRAAGSLMKNGLARDATEAFDLITRGYQSNIDKGQDFTDTIDEYSPLFKRLGLDGETAFGLLNQGIEAGARNSDFLADALKEFQIRATDGSTTSAEGFRLLGLNAEKMTAQIAAGGEGAKNGLDTVLDRLRSVEDPVKRNAAAVALFGTKAEDLGDALFSLDPSEAVAALGQVEGAADRLGTTLNDNLKTKLEGYKRQLQALPGEIAGIIGSFASGDTGGAAVDIGALFGLDEDSAVVERIRFVLDDVRAVFADAIGFAREKLGEAQAFIAEIMPQIEEAVGHALAAVQWWWHLVGDDVASYVDRLFHLMEGVISGVMKAIQGVIQTVLAIINGDWSLAWDGIKTTLAGVWDAMFAIISGALGLTSSTIGAALSLIGGVIEAGWNLAKDKVVEAWKAMMDAALEGADKIVGTARDLPSRAAEALGDLTRTLYGKGWDLLDGMLDGVENAQRGVSTFVSGLPGRVVDWVGDLGTLLTDGGRKLIQGLIDGIQEKLGDLRDKVGEAAGSVRDFWPFSPAKRGPLSGRGDLRLAGRGIIDRLALGVGESNALSKAIDDVAGTVAFPLSATAASQSALSGGSRGSLGATFNFTIHADSSTDMTALRDAVKSGVNEALAESERLSLPL
jgi:hypothetical protein